MKKSNQILTILFVLCLVLSTASVSAIEEDSWETKSPIPITEGFSKAGVVDGKIYVIGESTNYEYNPIADVWTEKTPLPTSRSNFGLAVYENKIYCIGGFIGYNQNTPQYTGLNEVYDPTTDTWETKEPMPLINSSLYFTYHVENKIHVIVQDIHYIYDILLDSWVTNGTPLPVIHEPHTLSTTVLDNKIYFFSQSDTQIFDTESDAWNFGTAMPEDGYYSSCVATTGEYAPKRIYIFGGMNIWLSASNTTLIYDPANDTWTKGSPLPTARYRPSCATINDTIYVIGGTVNLYFKSNENEQYIPMGYIPEFPLSTILVAGLSIVLVLSIIYRNRFSGKRK